jgi:hypothetical protein
MVFGKGVISSPCQRQCELLPSLGVRRPLTFHILIFSSETPQPNVKRKITLVYCIVNAVISIQISELNYSYMPLKPLSQMN